MKNKIIKCSNCGSSNFKQISNDLFECAYCSAKLQNDNSIKDDFINDINKSKAKKYIKYINAKISEEEFYKKALAHLSINQNTPTDLLNTAKFSFVEYEYKFFAVVDVDFASMQISADKENLVSLLFNQQTTSEIGQILCIDLGENHFPELIMDEVVENYKSVEYLSEDIDSQEKTNKITLPSKDTIKSKIDKCVETLKRKILASNKHSNHVSHKINEITIVALPIYSLKFTYKDKQYKIYSSANKLNLIGEFPINSSSLKSQVEKKVLPFTLLSCACSIGAIVFSIINLTNKLLGLIKYDVIFAVISLLGFGANYLANKIIYLKKSKELYIEKRNELKIFFEKSKINLTSEDEKYIQKFLRWF